MSTIEKINDNTNILTFDSIITLYQLDRTPNKESMLNYEKISKIFIKDTGINNLHKINKDVLNKWKACLISRVSPTSCNTYFRHIKALVRFAYDEGFLEENPFVKFRNVAVYKTKYKCIEPSDVRRLIEFLNSSEKPFPPYWFWILTIKMFYYSGIRLKQFIGLTWGDINFKTEVISLKAQHSKTKREWDIPIHSSLLFDLKALRSKFETIYGSEENILNNKQVFNVTLFNLNYSGSEMTREQVSGFFRNLSQKSGIQVSTKRFRHQLATELANNNENLKSVQKLLGHANIATTVGYVHTNIKDLKRTLDTTTTI